jgi:hypothetical protein
MRAPRLVTAAVASTAAAVLGLGLAGPAAAAPAPTVSVVGPVHLSPTGDSPRGDHVTVRYRCTGALNITLWLYQRPNRSETTGKAGLPLPCTNHVEVQRLPLRLMTPLSQALQPGQAELHLSILGGASSTTPIRVVR